MKIIQYQLCTIIREDDTTREVLYLVELPWSEQNEKLAQSEAYHGEYTILEKNDKENI